MAQAMGGDDLAARSLSSRRSFQTSGQHSFKGVWQQEQDVFTCIRTEENDEDELRCAAVERLPTYDRLGKSILMQCLEDGMKKANEIDVKKLGPEEKKRLMDTILNVLEEDKERCVKKLRSRADK